MKPKRDDCIFFDKKYCNLMWILMNIVPYGPVQNKSSFPAIRYQAFIRTTDDLSHWRACMLPGLKGFAK